MSDVVFILGAGASRQCGAPLMADFLDVATDLLRGGEVKDKKEHFERVFRTIGGLQQVHSKAQLNLNNIESIFTALELGKIIQRVPGIDANEIPEAVASLKEVIVATLGETIRFPVKGPYIGAPPPYGSFAKLVRYLIESAAPTQSVSVITFNYDIAVDVALFREEMGPDYVLEKAPMGRNQVQLMKLHGSLNWASEVENKRIRPLHPCQYFAEYSPRFPGEDSKLKLPVSHLKEYFSKKGCVVDPEPVIVPPTWNKADYHTALSNVWAAAATHLSEAEYVFIIGYSLPETDSFFRHLYALGSVGKAALRRIVIYNPDNSGETDKRFQALLGPGAMSRYRYETLTFDRALDSIREMFPGRK